MWGQFPPFPVPSDTDQHQRVEIKHDEQLGVEFIVKSITKRAKVARQFSIYTMRKFYAQTSMVSFRYFFF